VTPRTKQPRSLLIRDIHLLVTMDGRGRQIPGGYLYAEDGEIQAVGTRVPPRLRAERTIRAPVRRRRTRSGEYPPSSLPDPHAGASRGRDAKLFDWLTTL